jgi:predicted metalloprotease with PDZ domain
MGENGEMMTAGSEWGRHPLSLPATMFAMRCPWRPTADSAVAPELGFSARCERSVFWPITLVFCGFSAFAADLNYTFQVMQTPTPMLTVDLRFHVSEGESVELVLPNRYGGDGEMWRWIKDLAVVDGPVMLLDGDSPSNRKLDIRRGGTCHVRYTVDLPPESLQRVIYRRPIIRPGYIHLLGNTFLVHPGWRTQERHRVELLWRIPMNWRLANSFGLEQRRQEVNASIDELVQSVYVAGDYRFVSREVRGNPVVAGIRGEWPFSDADFADTVARIVDTQRRFFQDDTFPFYFVSMLPVDTLPGHISGVGRFHGFAVFRGAGGKLNDQLRYVLSHELTHTWIPTKTSRSAETPPHMFWFSEGFTEYYSYVIMLVSRIDTFDEFLTRFNEKIREYWTSLARNMPNEQAAAEYFTDEKAGKLPYLRGSLIALNWNAAIRVASDGHSSLNDFVRALVKRGSGRDQPVDAESIAAVASRFGVADPSKQLSDWVQSGRDVEIRADSFGACAELTTDARGVPSFRRKTTANVDCAGWFK